MRDQRPRRAKKALPRPPNWLAPYNPTGSLSGLVGGTYARILDGPSGVNNGVSNYVLLGTNFFSSPVTGSDSNLTVGQGTTLVHEFLHFYTGDNDANFVRDYGITVDTGAMETASSAINRWLQNGCTN